jgi:hypothetical protein
MHLNYKLGNVARRKSGNPENEKCIAFSSRNSSLHGRLIIEGVNDTKEFVEILPPCSTLDELVKALNLVLDKKTYSLSVRVSGTIYAAWQINSQRLNGNVSST